MLPAAGLKVEGMARGFAWLDTGTHDTLLEASQFIATLEMNRPGFPGGSFVLEVGAIKRKSSKFSPEVIERAVRMVFEAKDQYPSQWAAIESIVGKIGCTTETPRRWVRRVERD